tara:strand:- start:10150 stop:10917 length:768 start_codon:yes stop_codon:yes gene_type:complete
MKIEIANRVLTNAIEDVWMKGKYHNGDSAKNSQLTDYAMLELVEDNLLNIYNADNQTICRVTVPILRDRGEDASNMVVVEIDKMLKYLKTFTGDSVLLDADDFILLQDEGGGKRASLPLVVNHPNATMIARIQGYSISPENPVFSSVTFESIITTGSTLLTDAIKTCDVINNAKYLLDTNEEAFTISSRRSDIDKVDVVVETVSSNGESATVEITGQFHKFFRGSVAVTIYLKDESPVIWSSGDRILIKAPYITR